MTDRSIMMSRFVFPVLFVLVVLTSSLHAQRTRVERPVAKPTPTPKATVAAKPEQLTSVSEVLDVKPADPHFMHLQSLIERYGIVGLTRNKKLDAGARLTGSDLEAVERSVSDVVAMYLSTIDLPEAEKRKWFPTTCPLDTKRLMFSEKMVAAHFECLLAPGSLEELKPTEATLTRARFVILLAEALWASDARMSELEARAIRTKNEKRTPTPTPTPAPTPPLKLVEFSDRPGDFWNFVPGTWESDLSIDGKKSPRSNWKFSQRSGTDFTLTLDAGSSNPTNVRVWTVKKTPTRFGDPEYHTVNFDYSGHRFEGFIIVGGALKGTISRDGRSIGTWNAYRRIDVDYAGLAAAAAAGKRNAEAIEYYSKAIRVKPLASYLLERGNLHYIEKRYDQAIADYSQSIRFDTTSEAIYNRSLAYYYQKRYREAADDATTIINKFMPTLSLKRRGDLYVQRGWCHIGLNDKEAAIADFREALRIDPSSATAKKALNDIGVQP